VRSGADIARYVSTSESCTSSDAGDLLADYQIDLPSAAQDVVLQCVDFQADPRWVVSDAVLIRLTVPRGEVESMMNRERTGIFFSTVSTIGEVIHPWVADMLGESFDADTPATDVLITSAGPSVPARNVVVVVPPGDPVEMRVLVYERPS
jgi:hypothetical protein